MSETPPSQAELARIAGVMNATVRSNINILLKMVLDQGWEIVEKIPTSLFKKMEEYGKVSR